ncbi:MAG: HAMP domain-containing protein [Egibacteraceae bacterium]
MAAAKLGITATAKPTSDGQVLVDEADLRELLRALRAAKDGDFSARLPQGRDSLLAQIGGAFNEVVELNGKVNRELSRVGRLVGREGRMEERFSLDARGAWADTAASVNRLVEDLSRPTTEIARVIEAVAAGDLTQQMALKIQGQPVKGEFLRIGKTVNAMVHQLSAFSVEVSRVAREVGTDGKLGGQAKVRGVSGTWKDLTDNVNSMASNLTDQVRNIAQVTTAVAKGDVSQKITVEARGEVARLKETINTMVDQLSSFADEVTRVAREVGTEGILGGQAKVKGVSGTWKDLTDSVNSMASNLTSQVRNIAQVATAVARGDLSQKITVEAKGEVAVLADTINSMTDTLRAFADEVTRVAREVGTDGRLGGQAEVPNVSGTWKDLTDSVNFMASNLTGQVRDIAQVTTAVANGDLTQKITADVRGEMLQLKDTINTMVDQLSSFADEVTRMAREVGTEGRLGGQAQVRGVSGTWKDLTDSVNYMADSLTTQVRDIAQVTTAVANGDLSKKISVDVRGEMLELKNTVNTMVDRLSSFADEVTRVAREVGTEGRLGGQARVRGVSGRWKDLTDNVNSMADSLTAQVRDIARVTTAVANGDVSKKISVDVRGEMLELKNTVNTMVDQLSSFADEVTRVAREVGTEGRLGGQARVPGVSGTWRDLTDSVNIMADSLTVQVRAITEVATAVTQGDLTRSIAVEAKGEVAELKDHVNQMIANLAETTRRNTEQDWLKSNLARISGLMQGQRDLAAVSRLIMSELTPTVSAQHGAFFFKMGGEVEPELRLIASYGYKARKNVANRFAFGESLVGQAALEKSPILVTEAPADYIRISSGLGEAAPVNLVVLPILFEEEVLGVIELGSLRPFSEVHQTFLEQVIDTIGVVLSTIIANTRTEELLAESQRLAQELQAQQEELRRSNAELEFQASSLKASEELLQQQQEELQQTNSELEDKARLLAEQNRNIEVKNREIEIARLGLEEKAEQLALNSKYKSEFLANMSHELRTPLNSLLILAKLLADNQEANLTERQVEFARTIQTAGGDLLELINDILDLAKIEAGRMAIVPAEVRLADVCASVEESFQPVAGERNLDFTIQLRPGAPEVIVTDEQRLLQVLRNLLSNACKFTEQGSVGLFVEPAPDDVRFANPTLVQAEQVIAFGVADTGIGIPPDKLAEVFEAFQQADGTTSRRYGGSGLGLSISREITRLLGGELRATSTVGEGSTFVLYLPTSYTPPPGSDGQEDEGELAVQAPATQVTDDRSAIRNGDRILLVVSSNEDIVRDGMQLGRERCFKVVVTARGGSALALAREYRPDGILLDTQLSYTDGGALLAHLKQDVELRHVPIHVLASADTRQQALRLGAFGFTPMPAEHDALTGAIDALAGYLEDGRRRLLVVEDDETERAAIVALLGGPQVEIIAVGSSEEAETVLADGHVDCIVLDLKLPKTSGFALLERIKADQGAGGSPPTGQDFRAIPVIVYTGKELTRREETHLAKYAETIIVKDARSPDRLLEEVTLFLHQSGSQLREDQRRMLDQLHTGPGALTGKQVLIVDDDVRNVFALTSVLERQGMTVLFAENGRDGVALLEQNPDVALVLMDIMMPEMDGYEATDAIRKIPRFRKLPIIALTAKAMKGDREQSIAAGASDYIAKPVDVDQLLSLMRVWVS